MDNVYKPFLAIQKVALWKLEYKDKYNIINIIIGGGIQASYKILLINNSITFLPLHKYTKTESRQD